MSENEHFDAIWVANYKRIRKTLVGSRMSLDPVTGYMRPIGRDGFTAEDRATFIERFKVCRNLTQICKSIPIDIMSFYDAVAVDEKFKKDINEIWNLPNRPMQLNSGLEEIKHVEKRTVIEDLAKKMDKYK